MCVYLCINVFLYLCIDVSKFAVSRMKKNYLQSVKIVAHSN